MPQTDQLIGSIAASRLIGVSARTVHRLVAAGTLRPVMTAPGGAHGVWLFDRTDVEQVAAGRQVPRSATPRDPEQGQTPGRTRLDPAPAPADTARETA